MPTPEERDSMVAPATHPSTQDRMHRLRELSAMLDMRVASRDERARVMGEALLREVGVPAPPEAVRPSEHSLTPNFAEMVREMGRIYAPDLSNEETNRLAGEVIRDQAEATAREVLESLQEAARGLETLPAHSHEVPAIPMPPASLTDYDDSETRRDRDVDGSLVISEEDAERLNFANWLNDQTDEVLSDLVILHIFNGVGAGTTGYSAEMEMAWQVAKRLHQMELSVTCTWPRTYANDPNWEGVVMLWPHVVICGRSTRFEARSTSMPKALCIAALLAVLRSRPVSPAEKTVPHPEIGEGEET